MLLHTASHSVISCRSSRVYPASRPKSPQPRPAYISNLQLRCMVKVSAGASADRQLYLGLDFGTSGARATVINDEGAVAADVKRGYPLDGKADWASTWEDTLFQLLASIPAEMLKQVAGLAFDGTSATALLVDRATGHQLAPPKLYNEAQRSEVVAAAKSMSPPSHTATASTSTLCKLLTWHQSGVWQAAQSQGATPGLLHQADWLASLLHGNRTTTDWNNALKVGYDPAAEAYPPWLMNQPFSHMLPPRCVPPGSPVACVTPEVADRTGLPSSCVVAAGTTDSIAAFLAAGVREPGHAVTSLGSTLAIKLLSTTRVDDAAYGIYSHRLGDTWLVGGASNTGGAVLRAYFTDDQLAELTGRIDVNKPSGLDYYPLLQPGERFPVNDPHLKPRLTPRPEDDVMFLQGLLEGMSRIEGQAYQLLTELGTQPPVRQVFTAGGGAVNDRWTALRSQAIGVPVVRAAQGDASYGAALLARQAAQATK